MMNFTYYIIPSLLFILFIYAYVKKVNALESFVRGCREGLKVIYNIMPFVMSMILATTVFKSSGALQLLYRFIPDRWINLDLMSLILFKPLSGMAAQIVLNDIFSTYGPDSMIGILASVIAGSTDTLFYIVTIYFGAVSIQQVRHSMKVGLLTELFNILLGMLVVVFTYDFLFAS